MKAASFNPSPAREKQSRSRSRAGGRSNVTSSEKIVRSAEKALAGELKLPVAPGYCLRMVRLIVEHALGIEFYNEFLTHRVERAPGDDNDPWARDLERSMREDGYAILQPMTGQRYVGARIIKEFAQPGDLLFRHDVAPTKQGTNVGHVGILLHNNLVIENINARFRNDGFHRRGTSLTPVPYYRTTLVTRIP